MNKEEAQALVLRLGALPWPDREDVEIRATVNYQDIRPEWCVEVRHDTQGLLTLWWGEAFLDALAVAFEGWIPEEADHAAG